MPLIKYSSEQIENKNRELEIFIKKYPSTRVHVEDTYLVYSIRSGDILDSVNKANKLIEFLNLNLRASVTGRLTFKVS